MNDTKRVFYATLTTAALSALLASMAAAAEGFSAARPKAMPTVVSETGCPESQLYLTAAHPPQSNIGRREFEQPESLHVDGPKPPTITPPTIDFVPPFVPPDDSALMMQQSRPYQQTNFAAIMAASGLVEPPIVPPDKPFVPPDDMMQQSRPYQQTNFAAIMAASGLVEPPIVPPDNPIDSQEQLSQFSGVYGAPERI